MSLSAKQRALRRLQSNRSSGLTYEPVSTASKQAAFSNSPMLYYTVYDDNLAQVRKGVVYAHSLEELYYMAIDNASSLETFDTLYRVRPDFSPRTMTVRDLILTSFVGTSDGKVNTMLVCPYQGDSPYLPDTTLYAVVMSELLPNSRQTPLRIAMNVPSTMKKWSHMSKLSIFGGSVDSKLIELNNRVNCSQVVELRNDPEGSVRYSQRVLDEMEKAKNPPPPAPVESEAQPVLVDESQAISNGTQSGSAAVDNQEGEAVLGQPLSKETVPEAFPATDATTGSAAVGSTVGATTSSTAAISEDAEGRAPIALVTQEPNTSENIDVSKITGPLQAARLEDNITVVADDDAIAANESHPAFKSLEAEGHVAAATSAPELPSELTTKEATLETEEQHLVPSADKPVTSA